MSETRNLVRELLTEIAETVDTLLQLTDHDLDASCSHGCANEGGIRRLLIHNAEHDRMHAATISAARADNRRFQESELARLTRDLLRERVELVGLLLGPGDDLLGLTARGDDWDIRKQVEHVLYYERDSMRVVREEQALPA